MTCMYIGINHLADRELHAQFLEDSLYVYGIPTLFAEYSYSHFFLLSWSFGKVNRKEGLKLQGSHLFSLLDEGT